MREGREGEKGRIKSRVWAEPSGFPGGSDSKEFSRSVVSDSLGSSLNKSVLSDCFHDLSSKNRFIKSNEKIIQIIECFHLTKTFFHILL